MTSKEDDVQGELASMSNDGLAERVVRYRCKLEFRKAKQTHELITSEQSRIAEYVELEWERRFPAQTEESQTLLADQRLAIVEQEMWSVASDRLEADYLTALLGKIPSLHELFNNDRISGIIEGQLELIDTNDTFVQFLIKYLKLDAQELEGCVMAAEKRIATIDPDEFVLHLLNEAVDPDRDRVPPEYESGE